MDVRESGRGLDGCGGGASERYAEIQPRVGREMKKGDVDGLPVGFPAGSDDDASGADCPG